MKAIEFLRAFVRPYLEILLGSTMVGLTIYLVVKFASPEMATLIVPGVIGAGIALISHYAGERAGKPKGEK